MLVRPFPDLMAKACGSLVDNPGAANFVRLTMDQRRLSEILWVEEWKMPRRYTERVLPFRRPLKDAWGGWVVS